MKVQHILSRTCKDLCRFLFWFPLRWMCQAIPRRTMMRIGSAGGALLYHLSSKRRRSIFLAFQECSLGNSKKVLEPIVKKTFINFVKDQTEVLYFSRLTPDTVTNFTRVSGFENLSQAYSHEKGVILLLSHFGCEQLIMAVLGFRNLPIGQVSLPADYVNSVDRKTHVSFIHLKTLQTKRRLEESMPATFLFPHQGIWTILSWLKKKNIVAIAVDGRFSKRFVLVPFLGRQALFSPGPFIIATLSRAQLLPVFIKRLDDDSHHMIIERPLQMSRESMNTHETATHLLNQYIQRLEDYIKKSPEHYGMFLYQTYTHLQGETNAFFLS